MKFYGCYLREGLVYLPTNGRISNTTTAFRDVEPIEVVPVRDTTALQRGFAAMIVRGHPQLSLEEGRSSVTPLLKHAGVKSLRSFERGTLTWAIKDRDGALTIDAYRKHRDGGWEIDRSRAIVLPSGTTIAEAYDRLIAILQAYAADPALAAAHEVSPLEPKPFGTVENGFLMPPLNGERHESVEGLLVTIVNLESDDVPDIRINIQRVFYAVGDREGGDAFTSALAEALAPELDLAGRRRILEAYAPYTIGLPVDAARYGRDPVTHVIRSPRRVGDNPYDAEAELGASGNNTAERGIFSAVLAFAVRHVANLTYRILGPFFG
ncbi:MAG TPA: hypothetical protein VNT30_24125 [Stellaceae bacterium]|nr:hypothetical protein [Stellaceae bacterium]